MGDGASIGCARFERGDPVCRSTIKDLTGCRSIRESDIPSTRAVRKDSSSEGHAEKQNGADGGKDRHW